jgi:hypothetical protein
MNEHLRNLIAGLQETYPAIRAKMDAKDREIADLQARVQATDEGRPYEAITPDQVADLEAVLASFQALAA